MEFENFEECCIWRWIPFRKRRSCSTFGWRSCRDCPRNGAALPDLRSGSIAGSNHRRGPALTVNDRRIRRQRRRQRRPGVGGSLMTSPATSSTDSVVLVLPVMDWMETPKCLACIQCQGMLAQHRMNYNRWQLQLIIFNLTVEFSRFILLYFFFRK